MTTDTASQSTSDAVMEPAIIVIFGITGDLSNRYLLPSLYKLFRDNLLDEKTEIVGISRRELVVDELFSNLQANITATEGEYNQTVIDRMRSHLTPFQLDMDSLDGYHDLLKKLNDIEAEQAVCMNRLYYLSIPPAAYGTIIGHMGQSGLNQSCSHDVASTRLLVEKPFGHDLESAQALIETTATAFSEEQLFRIDHYLAKETAQNIVTFRFENPLFETVWNNEHVSRIDIVASEQIGIEGRAAFYEKQGALRDFIQNHLLQLLAISTMDEPERLDSESIHAAKLKVLEAIKPVTAAGALRGQYAGYRDEVANPQSITETFASITTTIDTDRWRGVPVTVRTGKAMSDRRTVVTFTFKDHTTGLVANELQFRIQPNEGIALKLLAKKPGLDHELLPVSMDFSYDQYFHGAHPGAYERVLMDAVRGDRSLFTSSQEVLAAWRVVDDIVDSWQQNDNGLRTYLPGTAIDELTAIE
jgi:glucose-6-phosphate 1-dehydrogenase